MNKHVFYWNLDFSGIYFDYFDRNWPVLATFSMKYWVFGFRWNSQIWTKHLIFGAKFWQQLVNSSFADIKSWSKIMSGAHDRSFIWCWWSIIRTQNFSTFLKFFWTQRYLRKKIQLFQKYIKNEESIKVGRKHRFQVELRFLTCKSAFLKFSTMIWYSHNSHRLNFIRRVSAQVSNQIQGLNTNSRSEKPHWSTSPYSGVLIKITIPKNEFLYKYVKRYLWFMPSKIYSSTETK